MSVADELEKLNNLRQQGIISDDEFQAQKVRLLQQSAPVATSPIAAKPTLPVGVGFVDKAAEHQAVGAEVKRLNMLSFALGIPGMGLQVYGNATGQMAITLLGTALLIGGLVMYAKMRGRHPAFGLLGLFSCIGILILYILDKKCLGCGATSPRGEAFCGSCGAPLGT